MQLIFKITLAIVMNTGLFWIIDQYIFQETFLITGGIYGYLVSGMVFSLINTLIKPMLTIITTPFRIITLGLASLAVNGFILFILQIILNALKLENITFLITGLLTYLIAGLILALANSLIKP